MTREEVEELVPATRQRGGRSGKEEGSLLQMGFLEDSLGVDGEEDRSTEWLGRGIMR